MMQGLVIQGRYRLLSKLGQGGMGSVWRAEHLELGTPVAVKLIDPSAADSKVALSRFKREAQAAASLRSINVVQILDYGVDENGVAYIVMELLEGESLSARLSRQAPLPPHETLHILEQVGRAVGRAHAMNIVHRDLKPDNVFLVRDGDEEIAKVLDFGIAKAMSNAVAEASIRTTSGAILGTPHYMSPEQASGRSSIDHRSDIWSFGVITFECLTGSRPFNGSTLGGLVIAICADPIPVPSAVATVPREFDGWFARCCCRDSAMRFQNMGEAIAALRFVCEPQLGESRALYSRRERTLQNGSGSFGFGNASLRSALASVDPLAAEPQTVSVASRTLGAAVKRRPLVATVTLALLVGVGATATTLGWWRSQSLTTAASASDSTAPAPVASELAPLRTATNASAQQEPMPAPGFAAAAVGSAPPSAERAPVIVSAPQLKERTPATVSAPRGNSGTASAAHSPALPKTRPAATPKPEEAEPAPDPVSDPAEPNPARRRNIEDRLAF